MLTGLNILTICAAMLGWCPTPVTVVKQREPKALPTAVIITCGPHWLKAVGVMTGFGMALLYPNLSAAVADIAHPNWRGSAIGIYRFWRDLGYGIGALALGLVANMSGVISTGFWFVAIAMLISGFIVWVWSEETHPRLNPAV